MSRSAVGVIVIEQWLTDLTTMEDAERRFSRLSGSRLWTAFRSVYREGDEVRYFRSPAKTWARKCGAFGVAIVRDGKVVAHFVALRT
jgi:hypothetical protein